MTFSPASLQGTLRRLWMKLKSPLFLQKEANSETKVTIILTHLNRQASGTMLTLVEIALLFSSTLSIAATIYLIVLEVRNYRDCIRRLGKTDEGYSRLRFFKMLFILNLAGANLIQSTSFILSASNLNYCQFEAMLVQFASVSSTLWTVGVALHFYSFCSFLRTFATENEHFFSTRNVSKQQRKTKILFFGWLIVAYLFPLLFSIFLWRVGWFKGQGTE